jgi:exonuclease SbcC
MIRSLELTNFRRHEKTRLEFSPDSQIVAITGANGQGKTTVLESILFSLYGETRHGRRGVSSLVRRGAEHEGMTVTMEFDVANTTYRIERRYEKGKHSAALYAGRTLHTQTAEGVTKAITDLLGMDAVGFRLATIAKQKELDGLAELTPAVRHKTISRLLRLDAVQAAVGSARDKHRQTRSQAEALAGSVSVPERTQALSAVRESAAEAEAALAEAKAALTDVERKLGGLVDVERDYQDAQMAFTRADATRAAAQQEVGRTLAALGALVVPDEVASPARPVEDVLSALAETDALLARGAAQQALARQLAEVRRRSESAQTRLTAAKAAADDLDDTDETAELEQNRAQVDVLRAERAKVTAEHEELLAAGAATKARLDDAHQRKRRADELGASCDACGQDIPDEHKHTQAAELDTTIATLDVEFDAQRTRAGELRARAAAIEADLGALERSAAALTTAHTYRQRALAELADAQKAAGVYSEDAKRLAEQVEDIDLEGAYETKALLEAERVQAVAATSAIAAREAAVARREELHVALTEAQARLEAADVAAAAAAPQAEIVAAWKDRQQLLLERDAEREFVSACERESARAGAEVKGAEQLLAAAERAADNAGKYRQQAEIAAKTATLLDTVAKRMATQIRPQLEGQVSAMLQMMSEGRFTSVEISDSYELTVCDHDGRYYPVSEFSGGETDLIALALRLALAQIVSARHGAGGAGFLILDEVFGSQDEVRRRAILEALRRLRGTYGQILLISHVGGIEDSADMVLSVGRDDEDEVARVAVS